jgi:hypothetical protein
MIGRRGVVRGLAGLVLAGCAGPPAPVASSPGPIVIQSPAVAREGSEEVSEVPAGAAAPAPTLVEAEAAPAPKLVEAVPEPMPEPVPFEGLEVVRLTELVAELERVAEELAEQPAVREDYEAFVAAHGLADSDALWRDYVRVKLVFESTRDGGLWHLRWDITNENPNSEQIWRQWKRAKVPEGEAVLPTAYAECDELSALFAFLVARLGVRHVGLYWPTWNHVVAVWTVRSKDDAPVRIVVPTSQIFLTNDDSLGTTGFDPWSQRTIYEYRRRDVKGSHVIDAELARFFVEQARRHAGLPQLELQRLRNERDAAMEAALAEKRGD